MNAMAGDFSYLQLLASIENRPTCSFAIPRNGICTEQCNIESELIDTRDTVSIYDVEENLSISDVSDENLKERIIGNSEELDGEIDRVDLSDYVSEESEDDIQQNYMLPYAEIYSEDDDDNDGDLHPSNPIPVETTEQAVLARTNQITSIENTDTSEPGKNKRKRHKKGEKLPSCRESRTMGAIEKAMRSSSDRMSGPIFQPIVGTSFDSAAEAYEFYNLYSWEKGFRISYGKSDTNRGNGYRTMQELQCANQGFDKRCINQSQRCGCKAVVRLLHTEDHGWYISKFVEEHNHVLSESCGEKMQWGSHRRIDESARHMIKYLRDNNVQLGKVHSIMRSIYGSVRDLPFTKRSLRTLCQQLAREQMDDDVKKTLAIFIKMREEDPDFSYSVDVDKHNRIKTLIWTNHRSKMQYQYFGDVFTFDTTFCTNIYKIPFGLFVGVNNHFQSVIYAGVLMRDEKIKSFIWVFNEFLSLMGGKAPVTILTDQCQAMVKAIQASIPNTTHLWCKWHVLRKAQESLGPVYSKNSAFRQEFHKVLNEMLTEDEFENAWEDLISRYKLRTNPFMVRIYGVRRMWAKPYSKDKFCARMMSTQRGESANHILKTYVRGNSTMNIFVEKYNDMMFDRAMEEDREEHKSKMVVKKSTKKMWPIQNHACKIYTRSSFKLFTTELEKSYHYVVATSEDSKIFEVNHAYSDLRQPWVRVCFRLTVDAEKDIFECECGLFTHFGILCCHAIRIMNYLGVAKIPECYILKRWTKDARDVLPGNLSYLQKDNKSMKSHTFCDSLLYGTAMKVVKFGNQDMETFTVMMKHFGNGIKAVSDILATRGETEPEEPKPCYESSDNKWHRAQRGGYQSEPDFGLKGKQIYSHGKKGAVVSKFNLSKLKAPLIIKSTSGRKRVKRFLSPVEKRRTVKKKSLDCREDTVSSIKQTRFCSVCKLPGHKKNTYLENKDNGKGKRKNPCCSVCKLPGHKASQCYNMTPSVDDYNYVDSSSGEEDE